MGKMLEKFIFIKSQLTILLTILLFKSLFGPVAFASIQDFRYQKAFKVQRLSLSDGLSQSVVNDVIQDRSGYIWLATEDGLNRFDSYEFKTFRHDHRNNNSLHENWVTSLVEEPGYGLWVGTVSGLSFYDPVDQSFTDHSSFNADLRTNIPSILVDDHAVVWVATDNGLFYVDRKINQVVPFLSSAGKALDDEITHLAESSKYIYAATSNCIYQIDKKDNRLINLCDIQTLKILHDYVLTVIKVQGEFLWVGTSKGLFRYNIQSNILTKYVNQPIDPSSISDNTINDLLLDNNASLWIATPKGLNLYNDNKEIFERYTQQTYAEDGLSSNDVTSLYLDNQNLIWLGTYGGGVNILDPNQHQFEHLLSRTDVLEVGNNNTIHGIEKDRLQNLWLASYGGGLLNYDLLTGKIFRPLTDSNFDYDEYVYSLLIDHSNRLWVGTLRDLIIVDVDRKRAFDTQFVIDGLLVEGIDNVTRIYEDHQGVIWIGSEKGLLKVTGIENKNDTLHIELTDLSYKLPNSFSNFSTTISTIIDDQYGNFWIGGYAGLVHYNVKQDEWRHYWYDKENPQSLSNDSVQVLYEDSQGFMWVGTADGLNRINPSEIDNDIFYFDRITTYEGLPNNSIYGILEDQQQQLWISTTSGLVKYTHNATNMDVFSSLDGLSSDEFNTGAYFSDNEGRLYFGSINGITIVNRDTSRTSFESKQILFSKVKVGNRNLDVYMLNNSKDPIIRQNSDEVAIDISVVNINYDKLGTQRYRYRILGLHDKWNYLGLSRKLFITGLPEGHYQLEVESQLAGQIWSQMRRLNIEVKTSFWSSSQAYALIALSVFILFFSSLFIIARLYKNRVNKVNNKIKVERLRVKELRADNEALKFELQIKESEVNSLNKTIEVDQKKLDVEKYRDATTGFYRINYLERLDEESFDNHSNYDSSDVFSGYKALAVFELSDYQTIYNNLGPLAVTELAAKVSICLRQKTVAQTQIFHVKNGMFLILDSQQEWKEFKDVIINLRHQISRSEFDVANGISAHSKVSLSIMDIRQSDINSKNELMVMVEMVLNFHQSENFDRHQIGNQLYPQKKARFFLQGKKNIDLVELQASGALVVDPF